MNLNNDGYIIYRNKLSSEILQTYLSGYIDNKINYNILDSCVDETLNYINMFNNWNSIYSKYRVSNNNNSQDASIFHRDLICQKSNKLKFIPIYTCVIYLDKTKMSLIPKSHLNLSMNLYQAIESYNNSIIVDIFPGDILLFNSSLIHKGNFIGEMKNRRVVQIFDIFPNIEIFNIYKNRIYNIPYFNNSKKNNILKTFSRYDIIKIIIFITYFNTATGYGNYIYSKTLPYKDIIFSSNGYSKMYDYNNLNYIQDINIYKYNKNINESFLFINETEKDELTYILYIKTYIITIIIFIIFIILLIILFKMVFRIITNKV
jgi:hypothetical protein